MKIKEHKKQFKKKKNSVPRLNKQTFRRNRKSTSDPNKNGPHSLKMKAAWAKKLKKRTLKLE